jgi:PadR family transcriptional regulator, regulatory protein PadR
MIGPQITLTTLAVLRALRTSRETYGLEIVRATGKASGSVYPVLARLEDAGWLTSRLEDLNPVREGRASRRYYQLTPDGSRHADAAFAEACAILGIDNAPLRPAGKNAALSPVFLPAREPA